MDSDVARELNREIRRIAQTLTAPADIAVPYGFVCECGCGGNVMLTLGEYDRAGGAWLPGHERRE